MLAPTPLLATHDVSKFNCGEAALDTWLRQRALRSERSGACRTYVLAEQSVVLAYYALAVGSVSHALTPGALRRNMPDPIPVMILARLAVDASFQNKGYAKGLVRDALLRTWQAAHIAGIRAVMVHALNEQATAFYLSCGFHASNIQPRTLFLALREVEQWIECSP